MTRASAPDLRSPPGRGGDEPAESRPDQDAPPGAAAPDDPNDTLVAEVAWLTRRLAAQAADEPPPQGSRSGRSSRLDQVATMLGLSAFERDTLLLASSVELDGRSATVVAGMTGTSDPRPTFGLALTLLDDGHWDAVAPAGPLRRWRLVTLGSDTPVATSRLRIDEDVLHYLTGLPLGLGELATVVDDLTAVHLAPSQQDTAERLVAMVEQADEPVVVQLTGDDRTARRGVAFQLVHRLGRGSVTVDGRSAADLRTLGTTPVLIDAAALPPVGPELTELATLLDRRDRLIGATPVIALDGTDARTTAAAHWLGAHLAARVVVVLGDSRGGMGDRMRVVAEIAHPSPGERRRLWRDVVRDRAAAGGADTEDASILQVADELAHHHRLGAAEIRAVARRWRLEVGVTTDGGTGDRGRRLRELARGSNRGAMGHLAQRLESSVGWEDLILPAGHTELLRDIVRQVRHRPTVHDDWGFAVRPTNGLGITALFAGDSGTGKTLAARVVANELGLDLYRIDLAATVDKYIGETEKNLSRIFDAAEDGGSVLLFDEADALFGRRGEVRHGQDRYANLEVAHLLQRMEAYHGLAILTTNLRANIDRAFLRRLRFVLQFPYPDASQRARIWRRAFPDATPRDGVDPERLARVSLTGGSIASIALSAAFAAAHDGTAVRPHHLLHAARIDASKHDRVLTDGDVAALS